MIKTICNLCKKEIKRDFKNRNFYTVQVDFQKMFQTIELCDKYGKPLQKFMEKNKLFKVK